MKKQLCNITKVSTQYQDRKVLILDVWAELEDSGVFSCFNMVLDSWDGEKKRRTGTSYGCEMIIQCLDFFGVNDLSEVKDYKCYVLTEKDRIWCASDVLGLEQLPFYEYRNNRQRIVKQEVLDEFVGDIDDRQI